jgi:hypothetical protein
LVFEERSGLTTAKEFVDKLRAIDEQSYTAMSLCAKQLKRNSSSLELAAIGTRKLSKLGITHANAAFGRKTKGKKSSRAQLSNNA